jgi:uncharacterized protein YkwD
MKIYLAILMAVTFTVKGQEWTAAQKTKANTASTVAILSPIEKGIIMYINLVRLYPKQFMNQEVKNYNGTFGQPDLVKNSPYKKSLIKQLETMQAVNALVFDKELYDNAKCLAQEQNKSGNVGHQREKCADKRCYECVMYGDLSAREIVLLWLIDDNEKSLGHRLNILQKSITKAGICEYAHKKHGRCAVLDLL